MKFSTPSLFLVIAIAFCCSEEEPDGSNTTNTTVEYEPAITPIGTPAGDPITKTIGISGGSISSPDGIIELVIPAGALPANTDITVQPVTNEAPGGIGLAYDLLPDGTTFSKPATLTFHYTDEDINGSSPFFIYIAYQDEAGAWVSDLKNQVLDTLAKTARLDISHFTINGLGTDNILIVGSGMDGHILEGRAIGLKAGQTSHMFAMESFPIVTSNGEQGTEYHPIPANLVSNWKVIGGSSNGTIEGTGTSAVYRAPGYIDRRRRVQISAHVNVTLIMYYRGTRIEAHGLDPVIEVTLIPEEPRNYEITFSYVDSTISPFYGRKGAQIPVYYDRAKFTLDLNFVNHAVQVTVSPFHNEPPTVTPATKGYSGTDFIWIPDTLGKINIDRVTLTSFGVPEDSILHFDVIHKNATSPGAITQSTEDGKIYNRQEPWPYGGVSAFQQHSRST